MFSLLILTFNSKKHLVSLFASIEKVAGREIEKGLIEVVIVDNASTDGTPGEVKKYLKENIRFFQNDQNAGYAKGVNFAAGKAKGELLMVINPDARLVDCDFQRIKEEFKKNEHMGIAGLILERENGTRERSAGTFYNSFTFLLFCLGLESIIGLRFSPLQKTRVDYVSGGFIVFRKSVFERLNGYDEDYFMYVEDMDMCYRARKMSIQVYFLPYAKVVHKGQGSSSREFAITHIYKGLALFYKKHHSLLNQIFVNNLLSAKAATIIFVGSLFGKKEIVSTYTKALNAIS